MSKRSFEVDEQTDKVLLDLQKKLGASSKAEVIAYAVALLRVATEQMKDDGTVDLSGIVGGNPTTTTLSLK